MKNEPLSAGKFWAVTKAQDAMRGYLEQMSEGELANLVENLQSVEIQAFKEMGNQIADNPRCYCPDCGADLGQFYSNRIRMEHGPVPTIVDTLADSAKREGKK